MKKLITILFLFLIQNLVTITIYAQGGIWTWISGSSIANAVGVYGTQGVPSVNNHPPAVYEASEWKDKQGNFWIYGGTDYNWDISTDLWKFNPVTLEWTWVKGSGLLNQQAYYGTKGIGNNLNTPGMAQFGSSTWVDTLGDFWFFSGAGGSNALWKYEISSNIWIWVNGTTNTNAMGVYGIKGVPSPLNVPGRRYETSSGWIDSLNNLWLFGGYGLGSSNQGLLNDLWKYNINTNEWAWLSGDFNVDVQANYGIKSLSNSTNNPGGRFTHSNWIDKNGYFWIFGGGDYFFCKNDLWEFEPDINEWVWLKGDTINNTLGSYSATCIFDSINMPRSRIEQSGSVVDQCGRCWLYGGAYNNISKTLNDLWVLESQQLKWALLSGANMANQLGSYGTIGVKASTNLPPSRAGSVAWWGDDNKFYMFGGYSHYCDLWVFEVDTNCLPLCIRPMPNFFSSDSLFCEKQCIDFTDISQNNPTSWQWTFNGATPTTSTEQNPTGICYNTYGSYEVTLVACNQFGCDTITKNNFITSYITPFDSIWFANDTLFAFPANSYQWYEVGAGLISNATLNYFVPLTLGNYYCVTKDSDGCESTSNVILYTSFFENENHEIANAVWPNPAYEILYVNPELLSNRNIIFEIYDMQGRIILQQMLSNNKNSINIALLATSVYSYRIMTEEKIIVQRKFVKQIKN